MASELLKNRALIQKLKEPETEDISFGLADSALDYSIESIEEDILPEAKPVELFEERERVRTERLSDTLTKIGGGLMDESVDFIKREEFDRGGVAKVLAHLDSLSEGTDIDLEYIRKYIADNNINASAKNVFDQLEPNKINRKQISSAGNETFTYNKEKRELLTRLNKKLNRVKARKYVPATKENLEKLDNLVKNTNLNIEQIGKELGFENPKSLKFSPTSKNVLVKEYIKKYGNPPEGRFRLTKLTPDTKIVKEAIRLKELGLSTRQVARELGTTNSAVVNYYRAGNREDLVGEVNVKKEGTPVDRKKAARMANIKEGQKFASKADKSFNKTEDLRVQKINNFLKNNSDQLANNQKFINLVNLKLDGKGNIISKNKSSEEIAKLLKKDRLFERDHISSVAKRKRNMQFPVNFQMAPYNINQGFFGAAEAYVNRPDADPEKIKKISNVLDQYGLRLSTNKGTIGAKQIPASEVINRNLKALDLPTDIGKKIKIPMQESGQKKLSALQEIYNRAGMNLDPALAARAVQEEFINPIFGERTRLPTSSKGIRSLATAGKIALPESYFAPLSIGLDVYAGRTPKEIALNVATLGIGAPVADAYRKAQVLKDLGYLSDYKKAMAKVNRADQALAEEVETLGMDTPAEEFAAPEFTKDERLAALIGQVQDLKLNKRLGEKAAEYQELRENQLKKGLLEVTPDEEELPEDLGIKPEIPVGEEEEEENLGFFDRITGNIPRDFMSKGGIMATRLGFASGTGPFPLRMMFIIKDRMQNLKNSTFSNYNDVFRMGEQKGVKNILEPYINIPNKNKLTTALEDIAELKKIMPEEYQSVLDDIANDTKQFNFKTASDRTKALAETIPSDMDFKKLSEDLFPMPNPENPSFILVGPDNPASAGRYSTTTTIDKFTGKGKRQVYDMFDEETGEFTRPGKLVEEEPLEEEYSEFIRDMDKPDETN